MQEQRKAEEYEEYLKDKLQVDEIVKKIYEEDKMYVVCFLFLYLFLSNVHFNGSVMSLIVRTQEATTRVWLPM